MTWALFAAGAMLAGLVLYTLSGGADFGGGVWDLLARGPRAAEQRRAIERALAPVWEANHVWLIFVIVVLFTAFPPAFGRLGTDLHAPLTLMLLGIVARGSAFVFRQYGGDGHERAWGRAFAIASVVTPLFLGVTLGAMTAGPAWWRPMPLAVGALALVTFAYLAAVYLTIETAGALQDDFRRRAIAAGVAVAAAASGCALLAPERFADRLLGSGWSAPLVVAFVAAAAGALWALVTRRFVLGRALAILEATILVVGWGAAQYPVLLAPDLTVYGAAAPPATLRVLAPILIGGSVVLFPSLWWLLRVFKQARGTDVAAGPRDASTPPRSP